MKCERKLGKLHIIFLTYVGLTKDSLIIADSMVKGFCNLRKTDVICRRGSDPLQLLKYLKGNKKIVKSSYKVIVLHIGTNWFGSKEEWGLYLQLMNNQISNKEYGILIKDKQEKSAKGEANVFRKIIIEIISYLQRYSSAIILLSGIIPRPWDHDKRKYIVENYNYMLSGLCNNINVFYINTPKLFLYSDGEVITRLFSWDGLHLELEGTKQLQSFFSERIWRYMNV